MIMKDLQCPYCDTYQEPPDECHEQDVPHECECEKCGMIFIFYVDYYPSYRENKAPCLNDGDHKYEITNRCIYCGDEQRTKPQGG